MQACCGWGKESAHQDEQQHAEPHDEHGLLHGRGIIGNDESQARHDQNEYEGAQIDGEQTALGKQAICSPGQQHAEVQYQKTDHPVRQKLGKGKREAAYRRDVDLFDGSFLFSLTTLRAGRKPQSITSTMVRRAGAI